LQRFILQELHSEIGMAPSASPVEDPFDPAWTTVDKSHLAFYSLNGRALARVRMLLVSRFANATISTFENKEGGGAALLDGARSADVFVLAWGAARHPAVAYVADYRPNSRATLTAAGQGSASLLAAVDGWIGKTTTMPAKKRSVDLPDGDDVTDSPAMLAEVGRLRNRLEPKLRVFIKRTLKTHLGAKWIQFVVTALPESMREQCIGVDAEKILNERLFLANLVTILQTGWDKYFKVLESGPSSQSVKKASVQVLLDYVNTHREDAHAKAVSGADFAALQVAVKALEGALTRHLQD
jgi:hypothetical protein